MAKSGKMLYWIALFFSLFVAGFYSLFPELDLLLADKVYVFVSLR